MKFLKFYYKKKITHTHTRFLSVVVNHVTNQAQFILLAENEESHRGYSTQLSNKPTIKEINSSKIDRKTEHISKRSGLSYHASAIADHITSTGQNIKRDHFEILAEPGIQIFIVELKSLR